MQYRISDITVILYELVCEIVCLLSLSLHCTLLQLVCHLLYKYHLLSAIIFHSAVNNSNNNGTSRLSVHWQTLMWPQLPEKLVQ